MITWKGIVTFTGTRILFGADVPEYSEITAAIFEGNCKLVT